MRCGVEQLCVLDLDGAGFTMLSMLGGKEAWNIWTSNNKVSGFNEGGFLLLDGLLGLWTSSNSTLLSPSPAPKHSHSLFHQQVEPLDSKTCPVTSTSKLAEHGSRPEHCERRYKNWPRHGFWQGQTMWRLCQPHRRDVESNRKLAPCCAKGQKLYATR